jgi:tetratricopeptide (TPR) repeat protein
MPSRSIFAVVFTFIAATAHAQSDVQRLFEAGRYQQVVDAATPEAAPDVIYAAAQSQQKLGANEQAVELYSRLAERPEGDPWRSIGESGRLLVQGDADGAIAAARQAVEAGGALAETHYQMGLVLARREDWQAAATEFDTVTRLNPSNAYGHYYGGLMQYRANRPDRMAIHFEQFLKLAPEAPERPEVAQIMRTIRGR